MHCHAYKGTELAPCSGIIVVRYLQVHATRADGLLRYSTCSACPGPPRVLIYSCYSHVTVYSTIYSLRRVAD